MPNSESSNDLRMASAELANVEMAGAQLGKSPAEIAWMQRAIRLEYARNLIGADRIEQAKELLSGCAPGIASFWLRLAIAWHLKRIARVDILKLLVDVEWWSRGRI